MSMPQDLVLIRHGQSEANIRQKASKNGDESLFTDDLVTVPDNSWRLTENGVMQAQTAGKYLQELFPQGFDHYITSPFMRTRETAANLKLQNAEWEENRIIRERSWGEIDGLSVQAFEKQYKHNFQLKSKDPIYWSPPAGESLANVAENRASNFLQSLSREAAGSKVLAVTHGEFILTMRMILEKWSDEKFHETEVDPAYKIRNCIMVHYTRRNPETGKLTNRLNWVKLSYPFKENGKFTVIEGEWNSISESRKLSNQDLLNLVDMSERRLSNY